MEKEILLRLDRIEQNALLSAKQVLTFEDVALLTGFSKSHLYKLTSLGKIPHYKPGGKMVYFDRDELNSWLKQNRVTSNNEIEEQADNYLAGL